jgi:hypothetical protein
MDLPVIKPEPPPWEAGDRPLQLWHGASLSEKVAGCVLAYAIAAMFVELQADDFVSNSVLAFHMF